MSERLSLVTLSSCLLCALSALPVAAHQLKVFAAAEGERIEGSVYFAGGGAAVGAAVSVRAPDGRLLAELVADGEGRFAFTAGQRVDHRLSAATGEGHAAEWTVSAAELPAGLPGPRDAGPAAAPAPADPSAGRDAVLWPDDAALESMIERAVARQVRPLREELLAAQGRARVSDVLGGIGYIVGIAGLALWWRARRGGLRP